MFTFDYYVYIVRCKDGSYYTGITNNVGLRINEHNKGIHPKSYTYSRRPVRFVYSSHFNDVWEAISWEKQIKRWSRKKKEALIYEEYEKLESLSWNQYCKRIDVMVRRAHHDISRLLSLNPSCHSELG
ncbi:MAG: GIY-YIG nuclease family protein [Patescibacteria group bacterium]